MDDGEREQIIDGRVQTTYQPTTQRMQKRIDGERDVLIVEGDRGGFQVQSFSFPLNFYLRKQFITRRQWAAGVKLNSLWERGCLAGYVQVQYRESDGGGPKKDFTPPGAFAVEYRDAMAAITGVSARRIAYAVCCEGISLRKQKALPTKSEQRVGMRQLHEALDELARHFKEQRDRQPNDPS